MIFYNEEGDKIEETEDGYLFINDECVAEPGTDAQLGKYDIEVMNGDGYYNRDGAFVRYRDAD